MWKKEIMMLVRRKFTVFILLFIWTIFVFGFQNLIGLLFSLRDLKENSAEGNDTSGLERCNIDELLNSKNGSVHVNTTTPSWAYLYQHTARNLMSGHHKPTTCRAVYRTAIIIPCRDRDEHLRIFLQHMHPFLQRQMIEYKIFVIEQMPGDAFNRGFLINVGVVEAIKSDNFSCFILHDVDMLPEDIRNLYACGTYPIHKAIAFKKFNYSMPYDSYFGGVSALTKEQFQKINGFSNVYFGWGKEDDDLELRIKMHKMRIYRGPKQIGRYTLSKHKQQQPIDGDTFIRKAKQRMDKDGLNSLHYEIIKSADRVLFTWMLVSFNKTEIRKPWNQQTPLGKN